MYVRVCVYVCMYVCTKYVYIYSMYIYIYTYIYIYIYIQLNPGNSNCQGKMKLLRVIGVSSYRGFEQKDHKHLIKVILYLYMFYCKISRNVRV